MAEQETSKETEDASPPKVEQTIGDNKEEGDKKTEGENIQEIENKEVGDNQQEVHKEDDTKKEDPKKEDDPKKDVDLKKNDVKKEDEEQQPKEEVLPGTDQTAEEDKKEEATAGTAEFLKKKKNEAKIRKVDMEEFYPDESVSSMEVGDVKAVKEEQVEGETPAALAREIEHSDEIIEGPKKDFTKVDPSFLDEFESSQEEFVTTGKKIDVAKAVEISAEVEEEEEEFQQEIYVQPPEREPSDRVYDQICDLETPISTDDSFSLPRFAHIPRRKLTKTRKAAKEEDKWLSESESGLSVEVPSNLLSYLVENIVPDLKKTLMEVATYQPQNAVYYMTHSLLHKTKDPEELGLEPDPHLIQLIVDGQRKKKKHAAVHKKPDIVFEPCGESEIVISRVADIPKVSSSDEEDPSHMHKIQKKFKKDKDKMLIEEKEKRSHLDKKSLLPGPCLGPTTLPLVL